MQITDALCGRTIEYVERHDDCIVLNTVCGHTVKLEVKDGQIVLGGVGVSIALPGQISRNSQGHL